MTARPGRRRKSARFDGWSTNPLVEYYVEENCVPAGNAAGTFMRTVTVTNPGSQSGTVGTAESVQIHATDSAGAALTYGASGLPAGLSINSSTGIISGTPAASGSSSVKVTATDSTGATGSATFTWSISGSGTPPPPGGACKVVCTSNAWPGGFSQSGEAVTLTNASYNGSIPAGGSVTDGIQGTWTINDAVPASFTLNGTACSS